MKTWARVLSAIAILSAVNVRAEQISGTVAEVTGNTITVTPDGEMLPSVGDEVEIFFKLAGADDEISVAIGKVISTEAGTVTVEIRESTGTVEKGQLARVKSNNPEKRTASVKPAATSPPATTTSASPSPPVSELAKTPAIAQTPAPSGGDPGFAFVDMNGIFKDHPKTKSFEVKINEAKNAAKKEYDERSAAYKAALEEIDALNKKLDSPKLSEPAKTELQTDRDNKIAAIKTMEEEIKKFGDARQQELQEQATKMREEIVSEMTASVNRLAGDRIELLFDRSGQSHNGIPIVVFSPSAAEMSPRVTSALQGQSAAAFEPTRGLMIGLIDMNRVFKYYNKTRDSEVKINVAKEAAKKEYDRRATAYKSLLTKINDLNSQIDSTSNENPKARLAKDRDNKIAQVKIMEREINEFRQTRENQLQNDALKMRNGLVAEITAALTRRLAGEGSALIFDSSGNSLNGVPFVLSASGVPDLSDEIIAIVNKTSARSISRPVSLVSSTGLKFGYIDMDRAFKASPAGKQAETEINELKERAKAEMATADAAARTKKEEEVQELAVKKRADVMQKLTESVGQVVRHEDLNFVFDSSGKSLNDVPFVVSTHSLPDLTDKVISRVAGSTP
jgi:outer membrane protein